MQLKHYCGSCGSPNFYVSNKPKFCNECGFNFLTQSFAKAAKPKVKARPVEPEEVEDEEDTEIPDSSNFKVEIQRIENRGEKFENIINGSKSGFTRQPGKYTIEDFKKEAVNPSQPLELGGADE